MTRSMIAVQMQLRWVKNTNTRVFGTIFGNETAEDLTRQNNVVQCYFSVNNKQLKIISEPENQFINNQIHKKTEIHKKEKN